MALILLLSTFDYNNLMLLLAAKRSQREFVGRKYIIQMVILKS